MNYMRKKSAVTKYGTDSQTSTDAELTSIISGDPLNFTKEEVGEIIAEIRKAEPKEVADPELPVPEEKEEDISKEAEKEFAASHAVPVQRAGTMLTYYKHKVKPVNESIVLRGKKETILKGYEKEGDVLHVTSIEPQHAEMLNQQVTNTMMYYFLEEQDNFLPAELFF